MEEKISVLDVQIDNYSAKEAMKKAVEYMQNDPINVIKIVTTDMLVQAGEMPELKEYIEHSDMVLAGETSILEAAGICDRKRLRETETSLFIKMFMRFLHKGGAKVFLLGESKEQLQKETDYIVKYYGGVEIIGSACVQPETPDDLILNLINGVEVDCIMVTLPTPLQEQFIARNKALFNAKVWLGLGKNFKLKGEGTDYKWMVKSILTNRLFRKEIEREKRKKEL